MAATMIYYLAWQEDDWLDEILDRFRQVNALVPTAKTFEQIQGQRDNGEVERAVIMLNAAHEQDKGKKFLEMLRSDQRLAHDPLYIVGLNETEAADWQTAYPHAKIIVITGYSFDFDYESVFKKVEADLEGRA